MDKCLDDSTILDHWKTMAILDMGVLDNAIRYDHKELTLSGMIRQNDGFGREKEI